MQLNSIGKKGGAAKSAKAKKDIPVNLAVRLESIQLSPDKPGLYKGFIVGSNEPVTIRMMTVEEGIAVNTRSVKNSETGASGPEDAETVRARLTKQYVGNGEAHRPRPADIANPKGKSHCAEGGLLLFTKCLQNQDGSYRAHWVETLEPTAGAGCEKMTANLRIVTSGYGEHKKQTVLADVVRPEAATILTKDNVSATLHSAFVNRLGDEKLKPFVIARIIDASNGRVILTPTAHASYVETHSTDPDTGIEVKGFEAADATESVKALFTTESGYEDALVMRAALFGFGNNEGYPHYQQRVYRDVDDNVGELVDVPADVVADLKQITDAVRAGTVYVELIPGERISAGPATRASILKAASANDNHPIKRLYIGRVQEEVDGPWKSERRFGETFLTTKVGKDGHKFFTKAVSVDLYPKMESLKKIATANDELLQSAAAQARVAEAAAEERIVDEAQLFDPAAIDGDIGDELDAKLASSAAALDFEM